MGEQMECPMCHGEGEIAYTEDAGATLEPPITREDAQRELSERPLWRVEQIHHIDYVFRGIVRRAPGMIGVSFVYDDETAALADAAEFGTGMKRVTATPCKRRGLG